MKNSFEKILQEIKLNIDVEIKKINETMVNYILSDIDFINKITNYIVSSRGKQLRSIIVILIAKMLNYNGNKNIYLASAIEFIHIATLMHDDVIDDGDVRHGIATSNAIWGNKNSVLVGDFLFAKSFELMVKCDNLGILELLAKSSSLIAKGEIMQMLFSESLDISIDEYVNIIYHKTACLFAAAAKSSALLAIDENNKINTVKINNCYQYGINLGILFQIIDDSLDYFSDNDLLGKKIGKDFYEKKITLPVIFLLKKVNKTEKEEISNYIYKENNLQTLKKLMNLMKKYEINQEIYCFALKYLNLAKDSLYDFTESKFKQYLILLAESSMYRFR